MSLTHNQVRTYLHSDESLRADLQAEIDQHLAGCNECREYAAFLERIEIDLHDLLPPPRLAETQVAEMIRKVKLQVQKRRKTRRFTGALSKAAWAGIALAAILFFAWLISRSAPVQGPTLLPLLDQASSYPAPTDEVQLEAATLYPPPSTPVEEGGPAAYPAPGSAPLPTTSPNSAYPPPPEMTDTSTPTVTPTPMIDAKGWYIYNDNQAGFSFSYPQDTLIIPSSVNVTMQFHLPGVFGYQGMEIQIYPNPQGLPVEEIAKKFFEGLAQKPAPIDFDAMAKPEPITVAGYAATKMIIPAVGSEFLIFVPNGENVLIFGPLHDPPVLYADPQALELMNEILSTLQLAAPASQP